MGRAPRHDGRQRERQRLSFQLCGLRRLCGGGGAINEDLFGTTSYLTNAALLQRLFDEKVQHTIQELKDKGWKWVKLLDGQNVWNHKFDRQPPRGKIEQTDEQKDARATQVEHLKALQAEYEQMDTPDSDLNSPTNSKTAFRNSVNSSP